MSARRWCDQCRQYHEPHGHDWPARSLRPVLVEPQTDAQELAAAIELLNSRGVHINTRNEKGVVQPLTSETVLALAAIVRALDKAYASREGADLGK